ncbi:hypothetical protein BJ986_001051 [Phycicoccus badiiscoriae]|uniref:Sensor protein KdpD transmembrane domain-containing protein n=1 Tax=Pedococcus badiiscoriae TaxID=642776 RepID=A0A852WIT9_9MICO|nr:DUF4118 domain-containing protein [Pedococcus badiiscoriae]NYG06564.1 hypothetical protein [Pedococcus badiiscoriae]
MDLNQLIARHRSVVIGACAATPLALCALVSAAPVTVPLASAAVALVVVIVAASATGIRAAGLWSAVSSAAGFDFFLTAPYRSLAIGRTEDVQVTVLLLVVGLAVTELALWGQRQRAALGRQRGYLDGVLATAESVAHHAGSPAVTSAVADRIRELLDLDRCEFVASGTLLPGPVLGRDGTITRGGTRLDVERGGLPVDSIVVLPVRSGAVVSGYFQLTAATHVARPTLDQRRVAALLADQVASLSTA